VGHAGGSASRSSATPPEGIGKSNPPVRGSLELPRVLGVLEGGPRDAGGVTSFDAIGWSSSAGSQKLGAQKSTPSRRRVRPAAPDRGRSCLRRCSASAGHRLTEEGADQGIERRRRDRCRPDPAVSLDEIVIDMYQPERSRVLIRRAAAARRRAGQDHPGLVHRFALGCCVRCGGHSRRSGRRLLDRQPPARRAGSGRARRWHFQGSRCRRSLERLDPPGDSV